jgi:hypothetical protein
MAAFDQFYALPIAREVRTGGVYVFRSMSPAHTSELLFRTGTCVRVLGRPDARGRVQVQFKDQAKFNLGTNNLVARSEQTDAIAQEVQRQATESRAKGKALQSEFELKALIASFGTYERPEAETAELTDLPY